MGFDLKDYGKKTMKVDDSRVGRTAVDYLDLKNWGIPGLMDCAKQSWKVDEYGV